MIRQEMKGILMTSNRMIKPKRLTKTIPPLKGPVPQGLPYGKKPVIKTNISGLKNGRYSGR